MGSAHARYKECYGATVLLLYSVAAVAVLPGKMILHVNAGAGWLHGAAAHSKEDASLLACCCCACACKQSPSAGQLELSVMACVTLYNGPPAAAAVLDQPLYSGCEPSSHALKP